MYIDRYRIYFTDLGFVLAEEIKFKIQEIISQVTPPPPDHYKIILCHHLGKVLVAPLGTSVLNSYIR